MGMISHEKCEHHVSSGFLLALLSSPYYGMKYSASRQMVARQNTSSSLNLQYDLLRSTNHCSELLALCTTFHQIA